MLNSLRTEPADDDSEFLEVKQIITVTKQIKTLGARLE